jgi:hypothetical protein
MEVVSSTKLTIYFVAAIIVIALVAGAVNMMGAMTFSDAYEYFQETDGFRLQYEQWGEDLMTESATWKVERTADASRFIDWAEQFNEIFDFDLRIAYDTSSKVLMFTIYNNGVTTLYIYFG